MSVPLPLDSGQLLQIADVAALLYVDAATVARWAEAGRLTPVDTPGLGRRFAKADVLRLMVDIKVTSKSAAGRGPRETPKMAGGSARGIAAAEAALDVSLIVADVNAAEVLTAGAATRAGRERAVAGLAAAQLVADDAAQNVVATRFRADAAASRVQAAADKAAASERRRAGHDGAVAIRRAAQTAATVEAAAVAVARETAELAETVARTVALTAELVAMTRVTLDRAIAAEVAATAAAVELRAMAVAHVAAADVAARIGPAAPL